MGRKTARRGSCCGAPAHRKIEGCIDDTNARVSTAETNERVEESTGTRNSIALQERDCGGGGVVSERSEKKTE